jgi:hypothetical protein
MESHLNIPILKASTPFPSFYFLRFNLNAMAVAIKVKTHGVWRLSVAFTEASLTFRSRITVRVEGFLFLPGTNGYGYLGIGTGEEELKRVS